MEKLTESFWGTLYHSDSETFVSHNLGDLDQSTFPFEFLNLDTGSYTAKNFQIVRELQEIDPRDLTSDQAQRLAFYELEEQSAQSLPKCTEDEPWGHRVNPRAVHLMQVMDKLNGVNQTFSERYSG